MVVGLIANFAQTRFLVTLKPLVPDLNRVNPWQGLKRLFSPRGVVDLLKNLAKVLAIGTVVFRSLVGNIELIAATSGMALWPAAAVIAQVGLTMILRVGVLLVIIAAFDYFYQRWQFERDIRLSKQEVLQELHNVEGNPLIKSRRRQTQRQLAFQRMMMAVPDADLVVTNPTHLAIALEYKAEKGMFAPVVLAKGQRLIAERIVRIARDHDIPIVQNIPLAHALYKTVEAGQQIPPALYKAMAEVLAYVFRLRADRQ